MEAKNVKHLSTSDDNNKEMANKLVLDQKPMVTSLIHAIFIQNILRNKFL